MISLLFETLWSCPNVQFVKMFLFSYKKLCPFWCCQFDDELERIHQSIERKALFFVCAVLHEHEQLVTRKSIEVNRERLEEETTAAEWNQINGFQVIWQQGSFIAYLPPKVAAEKNTQWIFCWFCFRRAAEFHSENSWSSQLLFLNWKSLHYWMIDDHNR